MPCCGRRPYSAGMARRIVPLESTGHSPSRGRCFVYVLPCAYEDILKLGFSRDPLDRMQALHPRWFEFFDLNEGFLLQTETVRDARDMEVGLQRVVAEHNAPAPLVIRREAAGHGEWYRGAQALLSRAAATLGAGGYVLHASLAPWVRERLLERSDRLYAWTLAMLSQDDLELPVATPSKQQVRDRLDAFVALGIDLEPLLSPEIHAWYARRGCP